MSTRILLKSDFRSNYCGKGRNEVNRAIKRGINFEIIEFKEFLEYSYNWARKKKLAPANKIYQKDSYQLLCTKASLDNSYLSAHVYILSTNTARLLYSVTNLDADKTIVGLANRFNHDRDFEFFSENGYDFVDLGGIGSDTPGITKFKRSFGGEDVLIVNAYSLLIHAIRRILR